MLLRDALALWAESAKPARSTVNRRRYELSHWLRRGGCADCSGVTSSGLAEWSDRAKNSGVANPTISSVIASVRLLAGIGGATVDKPRLSTLPVEIRHTPTLTDVDAVIAIADEWWKFSLSLLAITGMRLGDVERFKPDFVAGDAVRWSASKTGKRQSVPVPKNLAEHLRSWSWGRCRKVVYRDLKALCEAAHVDPFTPQGLRRLAAQQWERAHAGCGPALLGHTPAGWGAATRSYIDPAELLRIGFPRLKLPAWLTTEDDSSDRLTMAMSRLTMEQREHLAAIAVAMAK